MRIRGAGGSGRRFVQIAIGAAAMLAPAALATAASAQTLTVDKPCYVDVGLTPALMTVTGTGFVPGDEVLVSSSDGSVAADTTANPAGDILVQTGAPLFVSTLPSARTVTLTAQDFTPTGTTITATTPVTSTTLAVVTKPSQARLTSKVTWYFAGFEPGKYIYGHYLRKHPVTRARFGRAQGPCGMLKVRARFYPGGHPRYSKYKLQVDDARKYSKHSLPRYTLEITKFFF